MLAVAGVDLAVERGLLGAAAHYHYANLETNYILQRLEAFQGVAILTSNLDSAIDPALSRRISFEVRFPFPDLENRRALWERTLPMEAPREPDIDYDVLAARFVAREQPDERAYQRGRGGWCVAPDERAYVLVLGECHSIHRFQYLAVGPGCRRCVTLVRQPCRRTAAARSRPFLYLTTTLERRLAAARAQHVHRPPRRPSHASTSPRTNVAEQRSECDALRK